MCHQQQEGHNLLDTPGERSESALVIGDRRALRDHTREAIINAIVRGEFEPGERIVETRVARQLGVSQTTVREALRAIEQLGLIISIPNRGSMVRPPLTRRDVMEMYEVRALLEGHAAGVATAHVTDQDLVLLEQLVADMVQLATQGQVNAMLDRDVSFHAHIFKVAGNSLLTQLWSTIHPHLWTYLTVRGVLDLPPDHIASRHGEVVEALRTRQPERAEAAMRAHLLELRDRAADKLTDDKNAPA